MRDDVTASLATAPSEFYRKMYQKAMQNGWDYGLHEVGPKMAPKYQRAEAAFILPTFRFNYMFALTVKAGKLQNMRMFKVSDFPMCNDWFEKAPIFQDVYQYFPLCIILPKNSPSTPTFNKYIQRMFDHGIIMKLEQKFYLSRGIKFSVYLDHAFQIINFK